MGTKLLAVSMRTWPSGQVLFCQIPLILPDIHVVKLGSVAGLDLDLLGNFPAGVDPVALESAEDAIEAALIDPEPAFQSLTGVYKIF